MSNPADLADQVALIACADLVNRSGGCDFELGYLRDNVPVDQAGWYAHVKYQGARLTVDEQPSPTAAALALAARILTRGQCKCGRTATITEDRPDLCRWRLLRQEKRWESGCDAYGVDLPGSMRGDLRAMSAALAAATPGNRAERRRQERQNRKRPGRG